MSTVQSAMFGGSVLPNDKEIETINYIVSVHPKAVFDALKAKLAKDKMILSVGAMNQNIEGKVDGVS